MSPELLVIGERATQALEVWQSAMAVVQSAGIGRDLPNAHTPNATIGDIDTRVHAALAAVAKLQGSSADQLELIAQKLPTLKAASDAIEAQAASIHANLEAWHGATASDRNGHLSMQLSHPEKGASTFDLGSPMSIVAQQVGAVLDCLPYIALAAGDKAVSVFQGAARAAEGHLQQAKAAAHAAQSEVDSGATLSTELRNLVGQARELAQQAQDSLRNVASTKGEVDVHAAEIIQKLAQIREVSRDADTLQQKVTAFASQFEAFDSQMKARLQLFSDFEQATKEGQRLNEEREQKVQEIIDKADTMIRGATTAGLSKSLEDTKDDYEKRLEDTQKYFLGSVVLLLVCVLPIAAQLIPGPWQVHFAPVQNGALAESAPWLSALGKFILVLPATWATAFFARNYSELFHLSREYAHKAALAKAIDGFKREAPTYAQEIVSSVFMEIQDNPGSRRAPEPARPENPVTKKFLDKVLEAIRVIKG